MQSTDHAKKIVAIQTGVDFVNHPPHYTSHPSGIEVIQVTRGMMFNTGNAFKYLSRQGLKWDSAEDLKKARWYINDEIEAQTPGRVDWEFWALGLKFVEHEPNVAVADIMLNLINHSYNWYDDDSFSQLRAARYGLDSIIGA